MKARLQLPFCSELWAGTKFSSHAKTTNGHVGDNFHKFVHDLQLQGGGVERGKVAFVNVKDSKGVS